MLHVTKPTKTPCFKISKLRATAVALQNDLISYLVPLCDGSYAV